MAKNLLGIEIGSRSLKLALVNGSEVLKTAVADYHEHIMDGRQITSPDALAELIKDTMRKNGIRAKEAALVEFGPDVFIKHVTMPVMSRQQLEYNLPFEFRDYVNNEIKEYVYDYSMVTSEEELLDMLEGDENGSKEKPVMELLGVAIRKEYLMEREEVIKKAGLKLVKVAPDICGNIPLIYQMDPEGVKAGREYCILDLGYRSISMDMYIGDRYEVSRIVERGIFEAEKLVAEIFDVDYGKACTYFKTNYENCQYHERCMALYDAIAVELMRAVNFYTFNHMDSRLEDVWICGGGAEVPPFVEALKEHLKLNIHGADELIPGTGRVKDANLLIQVIGVTQD